MIFLIVPVTPDSTFSVPQDTAGKTQSTSRWGRGWMRSDRVALSRSERQYGCAGFHVPKLKGLWRSYGGEVATTCRQVLAVGADGHR